VGGVGTGTMGASMGRVREVAGAMSMLSVAGSPRFRVYELDLGFGRPTKVVIVGAGEPRHRAQTTRTPSNTEHGHHGGDGELDTHARERWFHCVTAQLS